MITAIDLRQQAAINRLYAEAIEDTISNTGHGSLYMAKLHLACAERKEAQAEELEAK